jgi:hypothetical protein
MVIRINNSMKNYYVYTYLREDGTPYYVGKGKGNRAYLNGRSTPKPPQLDRIQIIKENLTEEAAFALERKLIAEYGRKDLGTGILRNLTDGGEGVSGRVTKPESIEKRVAKNTGKKRTLEQRERMSLAQKGRKSNEYTEEQKAEISRKISESQKGKAKSEEHKAKLSKLNKGKSPGLRSEETKQKMRKPKSEAHRKAISDGRRAKYAALKAQQLC